MIVMVTGGAGFVGRRVCNRLYELGIDHIAVDNLDPLCGGDSNFPHYHLDITNTEALASFVLAYGVTDIIHLAAYGRNLTCQDHPSEAFDVNVVGTKNILELGRQSNCFHLNRIICCSSNIVLSDQPTVYKMTKQMDEELVKIYANLGVKTLALRPSNIYGAGQSPIEYQPCAFAGMNNCYKQNGYINVTGDGTQERDWVHVEDVADAFVHLLTYPRHIVWGSTFDVCTGMRYSINDVVKILGVPVRYVKARPGDAKTLISNPWPMDVAFNWTAERDFESTVWEAFPNVVRP